MISVILGHETYGVMGVIIFSKISSKRFLRLWFIVAYKLSRESYIPENYSHGYRIFFKIPNSSFFKLLKSMQVLIVSLATPKRFFQDPVSQG